MQHYKLQFLLPAKKKKKESQLKTWLQAQQLKETDDNLDQKKDYQKKKKHLKRLWIKEK